MNGKKLADTTSDSLPSMLEQMNIKAPISISVEANKIMDFGAETIRGQELRTRLKRTPS